MNRHKISNERRGPASKPGEVGTGTLSKLNDNANSRNYSFSYPSKKGYMRIGSEERIENNSPGWISLEQEVRNIRNEINALNNVFIALPDWYPLGADLACQYGYRTVDGLRKWCINNIHPEDFIKRGKNWFLSKRSLPLLNSARYNYRCQWPAKGHLK